MTNPQVPIQLFPCGWTRTEGTTKKTANEERLKPILDENPQIHRATLERARQVEEQLAAVGIKRGGYRLEHPLGGPMQLSQQPLRTRANR